MSDSVNGRMLVAGRLDGFTDEEGNSFDGVNALILELSPDDISKAINGTPITVVWGDPYTPEDQQ